MQRLSVQGLLPPVAPCIRRRISQLADPSDIQVLDGRILAVQIKVRHALLVGVAALRKVRDVLLQSNGNGRIGNTADRAGARLVGVVEGVRDIEAVQRRWCGEQVGVGLVVLRLVEIEGVAGEAQLCDESRSAVEIVSVTLRLAAVEDWRVECVGDVVEGFWVGTNGRKGGGDLLLDTAAVVDVRRREEKTLRAYQYLLSCVNVKMVVLLTSLAL